MKNIIMKSISAGPKGVMHPDISYPVDDVEAKALVDGGYAVYETGMIEIVKQAASQFVADKVKELEKEVEKEDETPVVTKPVVKKPSWSK